MLIDAHVHVFSPSQRERRAEIASVDRSFAAIYSDPHAKMATADDLLAMLDADGLDGAVAAGFAFEGAREIDEQNAALFEAAKNSAGRVAAVATLNLAAEGWQRTAGAALGLGARGFGELRPADQGWDPLGDASHDLCELAAAARVPLLWHVSEPVGHTYAGKEGGISPVDLIRLASDHPRTTMVAAHLGGGISFYLQMPEVRSAIENIYFDTAAAPLLYDEWSVTRLVELAGAGRVLFASDYPLLRPLRQLDGLRAVLPQAAAVQVLGGNAGRLFFGAATPNAAS